MISTILMVVDGRGRDKYCNVRIDRSVRELNFE